MAADTKHKQDRAPERTAAHDHPVHRSTPQSRMSPRRELDRPSYSPFSIMRQGIDEMEHWLGQIGWGRGSSARGFLSQLGQQIGDWAPAIEAFQRGNEFVVRAEVPGMNRQDLTVEAGDDSLTIHGERKQEHDEDRSGVFWSERSYGSFTRVVPLPPGTITDSAKASFTNGVLEVVMQAPSAETRRGRRIDISGAPVDGGDRK
jgi:HSP20 family protein